MKHNIPDKKIGLTFSLILACGRLFCMLNQRSLVLEQKLRGSFSSDCDVPSDSDVPCAVSAESVAKDDGISSLPDGLYVSSVSMRKENACIQSTPLGKVESVPALDATEGCGRLWSSVLSPSSSSLGKGSPLAVSNAVATPSPSLGHSGVEAMETMTASTAENPEDSIKRSSFPASAFPSVQNTVISFDNSKAGLQNVDKKKTEEIIAEVSKGSNFYRNEERKLKQRQGHLNKLLDKNNKYNSWCMRNPNASRSLSQRVDEIEEIMEKERCLNNVFAHLDMDMFYAAVEEKKNPTLKTLPVGVGSLSMLSTTNYVARQYGVRAGMPGFIGKKLCSELVLVPLDFKAYKEEAMAVREVVKRYDPQFRALGWDELSMKLSRKHLSKWIINYSFPDSAYKGEMKEAPVDGHPAKEKKEKEEKTRVTIGAKSESCQDHSFSFLSPARNSSPPQPSSRSSSLSPQRIGGITRMEHFKAAELAMAECRREIFEKTQLTASVGIAPSPELAKIASNYQKPNGQHCLALTSAEEIRNFLREKPVRTAQGIGKSTEFQLNGLRIRTLGDIYDSRYRLAYLLPKKTFSFLFATSIGCTPCSSFCGGRETKSPNLGTTEAVRQKKQQRLFFAELPSHYEKWEEGKEVEKEGNVQEERDDDSDAEEKEEEEDEEEELLSGHKRKSVGEESTFGVLASRTQLEEIARAHLHVAWKYINDHQFLAQQVVVRVKYHTYETRYSSKSVYPPTAKESVLLRVLDKLLFPLLPQYDKFRLLGVRLEKLMPNKRPSLSIPAPRIEEDKRNSLEHNGRVSSCASVGFFLSGGIQRTISDLLSSSKVEKLPGRNVKQEDRNREKTGSPFSRKRYRTLDPPHCTIDSKNNIEISASSLSVETSTRCDSDEEIVFISSSSSLSSLESPSVEAQGTKNEKEEKVSSEENVSEERSDLEGSHGIACLISPSSLCTDSQTSLAVASKEVEYVEVVED